MKRKIIIISWIIYFLLLAVDLIYGLINSNRGTFITFALYLFLFLPLFYFMVKNNHGLSILIIILFCLYDFVYTFINLIFCIKDFDINKLIEVIYVLCSLMFISLLIVKSFKILRNKEYTSSKFLVILFGIKIILYNVLFFIDGTFEFTTILDLFKSVLLYIPIGVYLNWFDSKEIEIFKG